MIISFDMDGTIATEDFDFDIWNNQLPKIYMKHKGISLSEARKEVFNEYKRLEGINEWTSLRFWFSHFGFEGDYKELLNMAVEKIRIYKDAEKIIPLLSQKYDLIVITQAPRDFINIKMKDFGRYFKRIFSIPDDFGRLKKNEEIYVKIIGIMGEKQFLHVGDHYDFDYLYPRKIGINALLLNRKRKKIVDGEIKSLYALKKYL